MNEEEEEEPGDKEEAQVGTENGVAGEERVLWGFRSLNPWRWVCLVKCDCVREREKWKIENGPGLVFI